MPRVPCGGVHVQKSKESLKSHRPNLVLLASLGYRVALSGIVNTVSPSKRSFASASAIMVDSLVTALRKKTRTLQA